MGEEDDFTDEPSEALAALAAVGQPATAVAARAPRLPSALPPCPLPLARQAAPHAVARLDACRTLLTQLGILPARRHELRLFDAFSKVGGAGWSDA